MSHPEQLLVNAEQAAKLLSISTRKLWSLTHRTTPALPHVRVGRSVRYSPHLLRDWITAQSQRAGSEASHE